jgi:putative NIF3 family GTP cyclohydrolase 1 type 2
VSATLTAGEIAQRIKDNYRINRGGLVSWNDNAVRDGFKFGGPDIVVTGVATMCFAPLKAVERAVQAGCNMIVPHEDPFYGTITPAAAESTLGGDAIYQEKVARMAAYNVVIFRIHDHMHSMQPDFISTGLARALGLPAAQGGIRVIPETSLGDLAAEFERRLGARALRVVGDPSTRVSRIRLSAGFGNPAITPSDTDLAITGERPESDDTGIDAPAYVRDAQSLGMAKAFIVLGHSVGEEQGMLEMADWIQAFTPELSVRHIPSGEPFWAPE